MLVDLDLTNKDTIAASLRRRASQLRNRAILHLNASESAMKAVLLARAEECDFIACTIEKSHLP